MNATGQMADERVIKARKGHKCTWVNTKWWTSFEKKRVRPKMVMNATEQMGDIAWLDYVARLRDELRDELPGTYHSLEHIHIKII